MFFLQREPYRVDKLPKRSPTTELGISSVILE